MDSIKTKAISLSPNGSYDKAFEELLSKIKSEIGFLLGRGRMQHLITFSYAITMQGNNYVASAIILYQ